MPTKSSPLLLVKSQLLILVNNLLMIPVPQQTQGKQQPLLQQAPVKNSLLIVGGRLSQYYSQWTTLSIDDWLLKTIRYGFKIPFTSPPPLRIQPQPTIPYNQKQDQLLDQEVSLLLNKGAMEEIQPTTPGFYSSMFVIPKKNGGSRPVFNLKKLNNYIQAPHFKMETLQEVTKQIKRNNYLTSIDLSDVFLHIQVHVDSRPYLRALAFYQAHQTYSRMGTNTTNSTECLPRRLDHHFRFDLTSNPSHPASNAKTGIARMDNQSRQIHFTTSAVIRTLRLLIGYHNDDRSTTREKSKGSSPKYSADSKAPHSVTTDYSQLNNAHSSSNFAVIPARLYTQHLLQMKNQTVRSSADWNIPQQLTTECIEELTWWKNNLIHWNGKSILPQTPQQTVYVDASDSEWGCSLQHNNNNKQTAFGHWTHQEAQMSINWRVC
ncbi:hypothetical protein INT47_012293 [Mucor saturninus]|uniref:Reverse transcriptase domain-containing protein n=1 Tax=Mucor saturninus TaxID=64648 RepID=A0A8H7QEK7_9FUNG|nr:hypothetical protein INT47_012293 [Mucor saturninus]